MKPGVFSLKISKRLWLWCFTPGYVIIASMLVLGLFTPVPYGDLTRIGRLSDAAFGWRAAPTLATKAYMKGAMLDQADVLVVGDSFSATLGWQSRLVESGYKVATVYWGHMGPLCSDFTPWIRRAGFKGRFVIVESVERLLGDRLKDGAVCASMSSDPVVTLEPSAKALEAVPGFALNWDVKLTSGLITYANMRRARDDSDETVFGGGTRVRSVHDGCRYFSHTLCEKALFLLTDTVNAPLDTKAVQQMRAFAQAQPELSFLWMVIPDKTTVYLDPQHAASFVAAFKAAGLGPDLFGLAAAERGKALGLYFPNDTHLSMHGQLIFGDHMLQTVSTVLPTPARIHRK